MRPMSFIFFRENSRRSAISLFLKRPRFFRQMSTRDRRDPPSVSATNQENRKRFYFPSAFPHFYDDDDH